MQKQALVSVIIPVYNRLDCLKRAIASVNEQEYTNWELIVVDDGSEIDIAGYVVTVKSKSANPVHFFRQQNQGPGIARKTGLQLAQGKYIQYLDSDDEILPQKLSRQVALLEAYPDAVMCYCPSVSVGPEGGESPRKFSDQYEPDLLKGALEWRRWHTSSCLWSYPEKSIAYWSKYYNGEDVLHDVGVGIHIRKVLYDSEMMVRAHQGVEQVSGKPPTKARLEKLKQALFGVRIECYHLLKEYNLLSNKIYADPLSERFFQGGLQLLKLHSLAKGLKSLGYSIITSRYYIRTVFTMGGILLALLTGTAFPNLFSMYFKLYRKITPEKVNFRRAV